MILEVSLDLKIYFINTIYSYSTKKILHLTFCCLFLCPKNPKLNIAGTSCSGDLFKEPQVSAIDRFNCNINPPKVNVIYPTKDNFTQPLIAEEILEELEVFKNDCYRVFSISKDEDLELHLKRELNS